jgi:polyhydroxyalkanoate synthesis regulator phasin
VVLLVWVSDISQKLYQFEIRSERCLLFRSSTNFPKDVKRVILDIMVSEGKLGEDQAKRLFDKMEADGRWQEESW